MVEARAHAGTLATGIGRGDCLDSTSYRNERSAFDSHITEQLASDAVCCRPTTATRCFSVSAYLGEPNLTASSTLRDYYRPDDRFQHIERCLLPGQENPRFPSGI